MRAIMMVLLFSACAESPPDGCGARGEICCEVDGFACDGDLVCQLNPGAGSGAGGGRGGPVFVCE